MTILKKNVLLIDNYDSFTWNIYQYLCQSKYCEKVSVYRNDKIDIEKIEKDIKPDTIVISPGPGHPHSDSGLSREIIRFFTGKVPVFGVCMGLQCIFDVFGGDVSYAGEIVHGKTTLIKHDGNVMFANVPQSVAVTRYHSLAGEQLSIPKNLVVTATTVEEPEIIMGVRHEKYTVEGVQFHPESILTECGHLMIDNLLTVSGGTWDESNEGATLRSSLKGNENILTKIYAKRQEDYQKIQLLPGKSFENLQISHSLSVSPPSVNFYDRMKYTQKCGQNIILSEFKRASPSKGLINPNAHPGKVGLDYALHGSTCISVLTEPNWFKGSLEDLVLVRRVLDVPEGLDYKRPAVLRKDFIFSEYQILESRLAGADTVLLIVKMLPDSLLELLYRYSWSLGMTPLVEVNDLEELKTALSLTFDGDTKEPLIIGVNNRNLTTFDVNLGTTSSLIEASKKSSRKGELLLLSLSGITTVEDVRKYKYEDKVDGFLIGESLMKAEDAGNVNQFLTDLCTC